MEYRSQRTREIFSCPGLDHSPGGTTQSLATSLSIYRDSQSELFRSHINGTEIVNAPVVNQTVELPQDIPDCYSFQCSVTASNNLDESPSSIINISFPLCMLYVTYFGSFSQGIIVVLNH